MAIVIGFLTLLLVLISLFLILLVLVQLPKKEAGVGMAFGAGMSEMLLGAGSGNVLTRITKYTVGIFLVLSLILSVLRSNEARTSGLGVTRALEEQARSTPTQTVPTPTPAPAAPGFQTLQLPGTDTNAGATGIPAEVTGTNDISLLQTPSLGATTTVINPTQPLTPPAVPPAEPVNPPPGNP